MKFKNRFTPNLLACLRHGKTNSIAKLMLSIGSMKVNEGSIF